MLAQPHFLYTEIIAVHFTRHLCKNNKCTHKSAGMLLLKKVMFLLLFWALPPYNKTTKIDTIFAVLL